MLKRTCLYAFLLSAVGSGGCGSPTTPGSDTTFQGTIAGSGGQTGTLTVTIQAVVVASSIGPSFQNGGLFAGIKRVWSAFAPVVLAAVSSVTGTVHLTGGGTTSLTGTYDPSSKTVTLSGGGFTFTGTISGGVLSGTYTGLNNSSGGFSSLNSTQTSVTTYCGTFTTPLPGDSGIFNMQVSANGTVSGVAFPTTATGGSPATFTGQLSGINLIIVSETGNTGTGTVQNGTVSGTLAATQSHGPGTFTGSASGC